MVFSLAFGKTYRIHSGGLNVFVEVPTRTYLPASSIVPPELFGMAFRVPSMVLSGSMCVPSTFQHLALNFPHDINVLSPCYLRIVTQHLNPFTTSRSVCAGCRRHMCAAFQEQPNFLFGKSIFLNEKVFFYFFIKLIEGVYFPLQLKSTL